MAKKILLCLVGLPAAGKSTLCSHLQELSLPYHIVHVCYDDLLPVVDHTEDAGAWHTARQDINRQIVSYLMQEDKGALKCRNVSCETLGSTDHVVLLDDNFYYRGMRKEVYHIAQQRSCVFGQVLFPVSSELAVAANSRRHTTTVSQQTIAKMESVIEYPSEPWEKHVLVLDKLDKYDDNTLESRTEKLLAFIELLQASAVELDPREDMARRESERQKTLVDYVQQCDVIMRRIISKMIKANREVGVSLPYKDYAECKNVILGRLKNGSIVINDREVGSLECRMSALLEELLLEKRT